ncbi:MAG: SDR family oxidoreductase [Bacteroidota bacterium]
MTKITFITGGSGGLGTDTALALAQAGNNIIFTYRNSEDGAKQTLSQLEDLGVKAQYLELDVTDAEAILALPEKLRPILNEWGATGIDYLVNNAGFGAYLPVGNGKLETVEQLFSVHFRGPYLLIENLLDLLNDGGGIVNVSTGLTRFALPGYGPYAAMKGALETYTKYLAKELGGRGIRANLIAPGAIDNEFNAAAFEHNPQIVEAIAANTALGRVGKSADIGKVVAFLCSDAAGWVNAQRLEASGGMFL